jgi:hypothetical protein
VNEQRVFVDNQASIDTAPSTIQNRDTGYRLFGLLFNLETAPNHTLLDPAFAVQP